MAGDNANDSAAKPIATTKRRRGRPKGSKNKKAPAVTSGQMTRRTRGQSGSDPAKTGAAEPGSGTRKRKRGADESGGEETEEPAAPPEKKKGRPSNK
ncbi:hypothetical protein B0H14DRAFT_3866398 [Mycena olivaceomarginata]|nr:hypothetical protein B0H14DRAFT_3866398 [Mycena olivaceomarginata]